MAKPNSCSNCKSDNWRKVEPPDLDLSDGATFAMLETNLTSSSGDKTETLRFDMWLCELCGHAMYMKQDD